MSSVNNNPFNVKLVDVVITKFDGTDSMSIMPQVAEFTLYQSIFSALLKADIVVSDLIGLMNNYPLSTQELVQVELEQSGEANPGEDTKTFTKVLKFVMTSIKEITISEDGRQQLYVMELASTEAFTNVKTIVSHAYNDNIEEMIKSVYNDYVVKEKPNPKELKIFEDTKKIRKLVIPMLKPFDAIAWLCKFAISENPEKYYTHAFFETMENFTFKALQRPTFRDDIDDTAFARAAKEKYFFVSNLELVKNNQVLLDALIERGFDETRSINYIKINKRYSALEKIVGGYFENDLVEINLLKNDYKITYKELKYKDYEFNTIKPGTGYNTEEYIQNIKDAYTDPESSPRVRYLINNYDDENQPSFRDKFGRSAQSFLAFQQVDISIAIPSNLLLRPGDLFYMEIPQFHGFNDNETDSYLTGFYIVSEIKSIMQQGGKSQTYLRLNRDSFEQNLELKHKYNFDQGQQ
jgi:hypothetical protein